MEDITNLFRKEGYQLDKLIKMREDYKRNPICIHYKNDNSHNGKAHKAPCIDEKKCNGYIRKCPEKKLVHEFINDIIKGYDKR